MVLVTITMLYGCAQFRNRALLPDSLHPAHLRSNNVIVALNELARCEYRLALPYKLPAMLIRSRRWWH